TESEYARETAVKLLRTQLAAAEQRLESQREVLEFQRRLMGAPESNRQAEDRLKANERVLLTESEVEQLRILLNYYANIGQAEPTAK
ncbi:MAG: hypothetical protein AAF961_08155, partial [Planctomycetota bacterium]